MLHDSSKLKIIAGSDLWNLTKNRELIFLSETINNLSRVTLTFLMRSFSSLGAFFDGWLVCSMIVQKLKIIAVPDLWNFTKNRESTILSETIHNTSRVTLTILMRCFAWLGALLMLHDSSKTQNYCRSGPVKFEEKSRIDNSITNHP